MRTARSRSRPGGLHQAPPPRDQTPGPGTHTREQTPPPPRPGTPPGADPLGADRPGNRHPTRSRPPRADTPLREQTPLWTEILTHASQNITLPQTSFAGGKDAFLNYRFPISVVLHSLTKFNAFTTRLNFMYFLALFDPRNLLDPAK